MIPLTACLLLALDASLPPEADLLRFPAVGEAIEARERASTYRGFLAGAAAFETAEPNRLAWTRGETCRRWLAWEALVTAHQRRG